METEQPGLFAAGDVRAQAARQIVSSAGDGATAAIRADHYLSERGVPARAAVGAASEGTSAAASEGTSAAASEGTSAD